MTITRRDFDITTHCIACVCQTKLQAEHIAAAFYATWMTKEFGSVEIHQDPHTQTWVVTQSVHLIVGCHLADVTVSTETKEYESDDELDD